jgi:hypothetical protein
MGHFQDRRPPWSLQRKPLDANRNRTHRISAISACGRSPRMWTLNWPPAQT